MTVTTSARYRRLKKAALASPEGREAYKSGRDSVRKSRATKKRARLPPKAST